MTIAVDRSGIPIDLLPDEVRSEQRARRILVGLAGGGVALLAILAILTVMQRSQISTAKAELADTRAQAAQLRAETGKLSHLALLESAVLASRRTLGTALEGDISWSRFLGDLDRAMPPGASLNTLNATSKLGVTPLGIESIGTAAYAGQVPNFPELSGWLRRMADIEGLEFVYLNNGAKPGDGVQTVTFNANAHLIDVMLSGRCAEPESRCP